MPRSYLSLRPALVHSHPEMLVMSAQVLDDREMLSLTSRSRATSRATSRTASPTGFSRRDKSLQSSVANVLPERDESKSEQTTNQQDSVRVVNQKSLLPSDGVGVGGTVACESALRSAGTLMSRVRASPSAPRPDGGP
ncbi:hypothetical protein PoB_004234400 [Plakobranchus ocellatus]|uniref:Uncharacterized protein n=1 Tax=Plakobranchus ocellatus TaxID=259542 RepID=A0AAV4BBV1_9GAST|nr:hypothetical protein PoB_004234400 [Plakobranchus ocellatus]